MALFGFYEMHLAIMIKYYNSLWIIQIHYQNINNRLAVFDIKQISGHSQRMVQDLNLEIQHFKIFLKSENNFESLKKCISYYISEPKIYRRTQIKYYCEKIELNYSIWRWALRNMDNSLSSAFKKQAGFKNKKAKQGATASTTTQKQPVHQSQIPPSFTSAEVSYGKESPFTIDEIDNIVTATTTAAAAASSEGRRVDKSKDISEVFANLASNPPAYFSQLEAGQNGKQIFLQMASSTTPIVQRTPFPQEFSQKLQQLSQNPSIKKMLNNNMLGANSITQWNAKNQQGKNPMIIEQTTTTQTTTTRTIKVNRSTALEHLASDNAKPLKGTMENINKRESISYQAEMFQKLMESDQLKGDVLYNKFLESQNGAFGSSRLLEDLGDPKIGELLYSDAPLSQKEKERKSRWLVDAYGAIVDKNDHKSQLLKLIEYNKIEICENDGFLEQKTEIEVVICKLMRQRLINDELKHELESHQFQGLMTEQQSLIYSIIKLTKKSIHTLYKKCANVIMTKQKSFNSQANHTSTLGFGPRKASATQHFGFQQQQQVFLKDLCVNSKDYIDIARKIADLYDEMVKKAQFFRVTTAKIFETTGGYSSFRHIQNESLTKGFFFMFIYKDFVIREILTLMNELLNNKVWQILATVEKDYYKFMENELVEWVSLMLQCGAFQSYSSIVTPNESQEFKKKPGGKLELQKINEGENYLQLQKRYMKIFMRVYHHMTSKNRSSHVMSVIDSDYDEDDEYQQNEIDEIFSISNDEGAHDFDPNKDELHSDFDSGEDERIHSRGVQCLDYDDEDDDYGNLKRRVRRPNNSHRLLFGMPQGDISSSNKIREAIQKGFLPGHYGNLDYESILRTKTREEITQMQQCEDCKQAHLNPLLICPKHGNFMQLPKPLSVSLSKEKIAKNFPMQFPVDNFDEDLDNYNNILLFIEQVYTIIMMTWMALKMLKSYQVRSKRKRKSEGKIRRKRRKTNLLIKPLGKRICLDRLVLKLKEAPRGMVRKMLSKTALK